MHGGAGIHRSNDIYYYSVLAIPGICISQSKPHFDLHKYLATGAPPTIEPRTSLRSAALPLPKDTPAFASFGLGMLLQLSTGLFPSVSLIDRRPGPTRLHRFLPVSSSSYRPDAEASPQELTGQELHPRRPLRRPLSRLSRRGSLPPVEVTGAINPTDSCPFDRLTRPLPPPSF